MKRVVQEASNIIRGLNKNVNERTSGRAAKLMPAANTAEIKSLALEVSFFAHDSDPGVIRLTKSFVWNYLMAGFSKELQKIDKDYYNECRVISL